MDGTVGDVRVVQSLDKTHGLDAEAVRAAKLWRFRPAMKDGWAITIEFTFVQDDGKYTR